MSTLGNQYRLKNRNLTDEQRVIGRRTDVAQRIGCCIFMLGIPVGIGGVILTIVVYTGNPELRKVASLPVLGPFMICLAAAFFVIGGYFSQIDDIRQLLCCANMDVTMPATFTDLKQKLAWKAILKCSVLFSNVNENNSSEPESSDVRQDNQDNKTDTSSSKTNFTSIVSLRHCKIYPEYSIPTSSQSVNLSNTSMSYEDRKIELGDYKIQLPQNSETNV